MFPVREISGQLHKRRQQRKKHLFFWQPLIVTVYSVDATVLIFLTIHKSCMLSPFWYSIQERLKVKLAVSTDNCSLA